MSCQAPHMKLAMEPLSHIQIPLRVLKSIPNSHLWAKERTGNEKDQTPTLNSQSQSLIPRCHLIMIPPSACCRGDFFDQKAKAASRFEIEKSS